MAKIESLHFDHEIWIKELEFYKGQIALYNDRIVELSSKNTGHEMRVHLDQIDNKFKVQSEQIDILEHHIKKHETALANEAKENEIKAIHTHFDEHSEMHDRMASFIKNYSEVKKEFLRFCEEWM